MPKPAKQQTDPLPPASKALRSGVSAQAAPSNESQADDAGVRILCVDDHAVLIEGLKAQFAIDGRIRIVGRLNSAEKLLEEVDRVRPDLVLLDIEMPGPDVFDVADRMRRLHPSLRFAFLSAHIREGYLASAYKCGAWGYFAKGDDLEDIVAGLKELAASTGGTFVMGPKVRQRCGVIRPSSTPAAAGDTAKPRTLLDALSPREIEILRLIGKGLSRVEIAKELSRSAKTIDGHQERIIKKLGVESRADLMRFAIREGFAEA
jgi:DNA-binding NarL/FixJ family response regulator